MDIMLTTLEAAEMAGVSRATILYWIRKGYLGDTGAQFVTRGRSCGYIIKQSDLDRYIHGCEIEEPEQKPVRKEERKVENKNPNLESMRMAARNLRIAIEFAQEELAKIEKLLPEEE